MNLQNARPIAQDGVKVKDIMDEDVLYRTTATLKISIEETTITIIIIIIIIMMIIIIIIIIIIISIYLYTMKTNYSRADVLVCRKKKH